MLADEKPLDFQLNCSIQSMAKLSSLQMGIFFFICSDKSLGLPEHFLSPEKILLRQQKLTKQDIYASSSLMRSNKKTKADHPAALAENF